MKKYLFICLLVLSNYATANTKNEISAFGKFTWSDTYSEAIEKLCTYQFASITFPLKMTRKDFCAIKNPSIDKINKQYNKDNSGFDMLNIDTFRIFDFENTSLYGGDTILNIRVNGMQLAGLAYEMQLTFSSGGETWAKGAFLSMRDKLSKVKVDNKIFLTSFFLDEIKFTAPKKYSDVEVDVARAKIYKKMFNKYSSMKLKKFKTFDEYASLSAKGQLKSSVVLNDRTLEYNAGKELENNFTQALVDYQANKKIDNSKDLIGEL